MKSHIGFLLFLAIFPFIGSGEEVKDKKYVVVISPHTLAKLARTEMDIYKLIKEFNGGNERIIQEWVTDYENSTLSSQETDPNDLEVQVADNPILSYKMMLRFATKIPDIFNFTKDTKFLEGLTQLEKLSGPWPVYKDALDILASLFRSQAMYNLKASELANGIFGDISTKYRLTGADCLSIAKFGIDFDYFTLGLDWLRVANERLSAEKGPAHGEVKKHLKNLISRHDSRFSRGDLNDYMFKDRIDNVMMGASDDFLLGHDHQILERSFAYNVSELASYPFFGQTHINQMALCNGKSLTSDEVRSKLRCFYSSQQPYFKIGPLKMEELNKDPYLVQVYDFIGDAQIEKIKRISKPILEPPPAITSDRTTRRSALYAWHADEETPETESFIRKIETFTGLNAYGHNASTDLQVANYAFGGYVAAHWDSFGETDDPRGDRLMTALFYLNDVKGGGRTAFPLLGVTVEPVKGSGVFWYLSWRDGSVDRRTMHGACPIIFGTKWIATKWIHQNENFIKYPCLKTY